MTDRNERAIRSAITEDRHRRQMERSQRRHQLTEARKTLKRNLKPNTGRREQWTRDDYEDDDAVDAARYRRIMPRTEGDRRRTIEQAAFRAPRPPAEQTLSPLTAALPRGLVLAVSNGLCRVDLDGREQLCRIRGSLLAEESSFTNVVAPGDEVLVGDDGAGGGIVEAVLPRRSALARPDVFRSHLRQVIVANVDQLVIVASWRDPIIWLELIDRYLVAAARDSLPALICANKIDLVEDPTEVERTLAPYRRLGYGVLLVSALTGAGIDELRAALRDRVSVVAGLSGVGKSSLLTAVQPGLQLRTGSVSGTKKNLGEGRHTTTQATLLRLEMGGTVVDTPGIREFGLSGLRRGDLGECFPEFAALDAECRYANCTHLNEPDCAVQAGLAAGMIAASRYHSYRQIYPTLPA